MKLVFKTIWIILSAAAAFSCYAHSIPVDEVTGHTVKIIENKGQWDHKALFRAAIPGGYLFITPTGFAYALYDEKAAFEISHKQSDATTIKGHNYFVEFEGANPQPDVVKSGASSEYYNFFSGNPSTWASECYAYQKIVMRNLYHGIDLEIVAKDEGIKLNFIVKPFANPDLIRLKYTGADALRIFDGALEVSTSVSVTKEEKPYSYQFVAGGPDEVPTEYVLDNNTIRFHQSAYDHSKTLVIDPNIIFSTFSGSVADNFGYTATYDNNGNGFAGGTVYSIGFPVTPGAYQVVFKGSPNGIDKDAGILKFSPDGKQLLYATYLGGTGQDNPHSMVCDLQGNLYIMGTTLSNDFPMAGVSFNDVFNGNYDIYVAELSADGKTLIASTYIGGSEDDGINGNANGRFYDKVNGPLAYNYGDHYRGEIIYDSTSGAVYVASTTESSVAQGFPIRNGFQTSFGGKQDGCVFKLRGDLSAMVFCSYIGGTGYDAAYGIVLDALKDIYITGGSTSSDIGPTLGVFQHHGDVDAFVAKINPQGNLLQRLVMLGTPVYDQAFLIQLDNDQNVYIAGQTASPSFPVRGSVYRVNSAKQFITIFDKDLLDYKISTTFGVPSSGVPDISPTALLVDICNRVYIAGWGGNSNRNYNQQTGITTGLAVTANAFQKTTDGSDFYITVFSPNIAGIAYATFLGGKLGGSGEHVDGGTSRFDKRAVIYQAVCAGCGGFSDFPTTPGAWSTVNKGKRPTGGGGGCNNAIFKMNMNVSEFPPVFSKSDTLLTITATQTLTYNFKVSDADGDSVYLLALGSILNLPVNPAKLLMTPTASAINAQLTWTPSCKNISKDTFVIVMDAWDNGCPTVKHTPAKIRVLVLPPPAPQSPYPECLKPINDSTLSLQWSYPSSGNLTNTYLFKRINGSDFLVLDSFPGSAIKKEIDNKSKQHLLNNYCYVLLSTNVCGISSDTSRLVCSIYKEDTNAIPGFYFAKDTTMFVQAGDTMSFSYSVLDSDHRDSVFTQLSGNLLTEPGLIGFSRVDSLAAGSIRFKFAGRCADLNRSDTLKINVYIQDNQCPYPRTAKGLIRLIVTMPPAGAGPVLRCVKVKNNNRVEVRWKKTPVNKYFDHFVLIKKFADGSFEKLAEVFHDTAFLFKDDRAPDNLTVNYCYAGYPVNECGLSGDTSDYSCTVRRPDEFPPDLSFHTVTVVDNKRIALFLQSSSNPADEFDRYHLYRRINEEQEKFTLIRVISEQTDSIQFDDSVKVQLRSYCYAIKQVNDCGLESQDAKEACSIWLRGKSRPFEHTLEWNQYNYWSVGTLGYDVMKQTQDLPPFNASVVGNKYNSYFDDRLDPEYGVFRYTIVANEGNAGNGYKSVSNTIELVQAPLLYVPNAFTPNGDGVNDDFNIRPVFVKDYDLQIFDRWGKLVFRTNDKHNTFKAEFLDAPAVSDVFVYLITYTGWDGSQKSLKGNFTILK